MRNVVGVDNWPATTVPVASKKLLPEEPSNLLVATMMGEARVD